MFVHATHIIVNYVKSHTISQTYRDVSFFISLNLELRIVHTDGRFFTETIGKYGFKTKIEKKCQILFVSIVMCTSRPYIMLMTRQTTNTF